ncbi:MAG: HD domain-containing protein [Gemmatimonadota bacterium]|nr:HD domain-containing protein [Gemmatimonadota bacterium]
MTRAGNGAPGSLRGFCGEHFPWTLIRDLVDGSDVVACYVVHEKRRARARNDRDYLDLRLGDRTGTIAAKVWDDVDRVDALCARDDIVGVRGKVGQYQEKLQITVRVLEPLEADGDELEYFLPVSRRDRAAMERELDALISTVRDPGLAALLARCLGRRGEWGVRFRTHPAATRNHHACIGGLLEHSLSVAGICDRLAEHYRAQGVEVDRDLLVTGALLHDLGKIRELSAGRCFAYSHEGQLLGHIVLGIQMVEQTCDTLPELPAERRLLLQHLIASHQGKLEWASPKIPVLLEGVILHYADDLDSKIHPATMLLGTVEPGEWTPFDRHLGRSLYRAAPFASPDLEPVEPAEAAQALIDLFPR